MTITTVPTNRSVAAADAAKRAKWEVQRRVTALNIVPAEVGLLGMAVNLLLRRPAEFPTFHFVRLRVEVVRRARKKPLDAADVAVVKLRAELLGSTIDSRFSRPLAGGDIDIVAYDAVRDAEDRHELQFDEGMVERVLDAAWSQFADFYGGRTYGRAGQIAAAEGFVPADGAELAEALRAIEAEAVVRARTAPRR